MSTLEAAPLEVAVSRAPPDEIFVAPPVVAPGAAAAAVPVPSSSVRNPVATAALIVFKSRLP